MQKTQVKALNGIDTPKLMDTIDAIRRDPARGQSKWMVTTEWKGGTRSDTHVTRFRIGGRTVVKDFTIRLDEPIELCGTNQYANPQETLQAAMNACIMATYVSVCAIKGIQLGSIRIETEGDIDLRGFLAIDSHVPAGYEEVRYTVHISAKDATEEQLQEVHRIVCKTSPNYYNIANAIPLKPTLVIE